MSHIKAEIERTAVDYSSMKDKGAKSTRVVVYAVYKRKMR